MEPNRYRIQRGGLVAFYSFQFLITTRAPWRNVIFVFGHRRTAPQYVATAVSKSSTPATFLLIEEQKEVPMWPKTSLIALGMASALAAVTSAPTLAQGVYVGPGGVGVDLGRPGWRERHYRDD
jgi:hypothetical protein